MYSYPNSAIPNHPNQKGHLYYVRLKTPMGVFYKLGFTTLSSVRERLAYQGKGDEKYIDKVFFFAYFDDALDMETALHAHFIGKSAFGPYSADSRMPLAGNGQSELYYEDILTCDTSYTEEQSRRALFQVHHILYKLPEQSEEAIREQTKRREKLDEATRTIAPVMEWVTRSYLRIFGRFDSPKKQEERERSEYYLARVSDLKRVARKIEIDRLYAWLKLHDLENDIKLALAAFKGKDPQQFESLVDVDRSVFNLAEAMTEDFFFGTDYMAFPNNYGLTALLDAMVEGNPRDLLMKPVEETYKAWLRNYLRNRPTSEDLILPDDPIYRVDDPTQERPNFFSPRNFLDDIGREWVIPDSPAFMQADGWIGFALTVKNNKTGFTGELRLCVERADNAKLVFSFPNLLWLEVAAWQHEMDYEESINPEKVKHRYAHRNAHLLGGSDFDVFGTEWVGWQKSAHQSIGWADGSCDRGLPRYL